MIIKNLRALGYATSSADWAAKQHWALKAVRKAEEGEVGAARPSRPFSAPLSHVIVVGRAAVSLPLSC